MDGLPQLGAGVSYRPAWRREMLSGVRLGCVEIIADDYLDPAPEALAELAQLAARFPLVPHGVGLSFGTDAPLDETLLRQAAALVERVRPPWFSDHVAFTTAHGWNIGHLAPLPLTRDAVEAVSRNVKRWRDATGVPLLLENITYVVALPGELTEAQFLTDIVEQSGCGLLLDLHNVHTNALNHGGDPYEFLEALPLERVGQVHVGGGHDEEDGFRIDSHSAPAPDPVWELLRYVAGRCEINAAIIEWDVEIPPFERVLREMEKARGILEGGRRPEGTESDRRPAAV